MSKKKKIAVVLFNLGGPDSKNAIRPFLLNFFMDRNIIDLPVPFRCILASKIANKRSKQEAGESYGELGNKSPLLENSKAQADALQEALDGKKYEYKTFVCMRYWHPMAPEVVKNIKDWGADKVVILPLYPQFSTTTTWSSLEVWKKALFQAGMDDLPSSMVCCYPENDGFISASAEHIQERYEKAAQDGHEAPRVLFSAHGLPEKVIKKGDPYQWQCEQSAAKIAAVLGNKMGVTDLDWQICYQSRVGRLKWIGPSLDEALEKAAKDGKAVVIYPHAFTQEHVETLVELDIEYKEEADKLGIKGYYRACTVGAADAFIDGLATLVRDYTMKDEVSAEGGSCICPDNFGRCCMRAS